RPDLDAADGRRALAGELRRRCVTLGRRVAVTTPSRRITGVAVDLTAHGHLVVETGSGTVEVSAGDVVHLRPADDDPPG
ncbi:MAG: biotin--[acetyl-CoA-carboxylase] ligase, partial [Acidimicrobiales bacterium]